MGTVTDEHLTVIPLAFIGEWTIKPYQTPETKSWDREVPDSTSPFDLLSDFDLFEVTEQFGN